MMEEAGAREAREAQEREEARRAQYQREEQERLKLMYGTPEEKEALAAQLRSDLDSLSKARDEARRAEAERDRAADLEMIEQAKYEELASSRQEQLKREYAEYVAAQNRKATEAKRTADRQRKLQELQEERERPDFFAGHFMKSTK